MKMKKLLPVLLIFLYLLKTAEPIKNKGNPQENEQEDQSQTNLEETEIAELQFGETVPVPAHTDVNELQVQDTPTFETLSLTPSQEEAAVDCCTDHSLRSMQAQGSNAGMLNNSVNHIRTTPSRLDPSNMRALNGYRCLADPAQAAVLYAPDLFSGQLQAPTLEQSDPVARVTQGLPEQQGNFIEEHVYAARNTQDSDEQDKLQASTAREPRLDALVTAEEANEQEGSQANAIEEPGAVAIYMSNQLSDEYEQVQANTVLEPLDTADNDEQDELPTNTLVTARANQQSAGLEQTEPEVVTLSCISYERLATQQMHFRLNGGDQQSHPPPIVFPRRLPDQRSTGAISRLLLNYFSDGSDQLQSSGLQSLIPMEMAAIDVTDGNQPIQNSSTARQDGILNWHIHGYRYRMHEAVLGQVPFLYSQPFRSPDGYKLCAKVYLNGDGLGANTHMSLFVVVMKGENDWCLEWPFRKRVTMTLIDQDTGLTNHSETLTPDPSSSSFQRPRQDMNIASGCPLFVSHETLQNPKYIKDDVMFLKFRVDTSNIIHP